MVDAVVRLPRGGVYVRSSAGAVQFGIPAETIKDGMALGLDVPSAYVVPRELFDRRRGVSVAEFEFPAYYSYFLLRRRARLVVESAAVEERVRAVFQETLFGPTSPPDVREFDEGYPLDARPDFRRESDYFRRRADGSRIQADDLVEFVRFEEGTATLSDRVSVQLHDGGYVVRDGSDELARLGLDVALPPRQHVAEAAVAFDPPAFGITVLGASHGFDPAGKTTGYILWIGGRGLLVDPPIDSTYYLSERGVAPTQIDGVVLTHCHADHDAGTFQKLLEERQIVLYTTPHILGSFLRKYAALSGLKEDLLRRTFQFQPVRIGAPVHVRGGELWFHYALHSIPTIGLEAFYGGQSLAVSADTLYDPARIEAMFTAEIVGRARRDELLRLGGHHKAILHEAGLPPLHTPVEALAALPDDVKKRVWLVHIASKDVPEGVGLRAARVGLEHTLRIDVAEPRFGEAMALLDVFSTVEFLRDLPLSRARALLQAASRLTLPAGETIVAEGARGDRFYIIVRGMVAVVKGGRQIRRYQAGDYFGETALILDQPRSADVVATSQVDLVAIDRGDFMTALRGTSTLRRLENLARIRAEGAWELIAANGVLVGLTSAQKTQLQSFLLPCSACQGEVLWTDGGVPSRAYLVGSAIVTLERIEANGAPLHPFVAGAFVGEFDAMRTGAPASTTARVAAPGRLFAMERGDLLRFFDENPGVLLSFLGARFVE
jgi:CRP-like cAMP-binding protein/glyoxylase-like metal-dependent hydrolase (beta-lactamase superfamily II)